MNDDNLDPRFEDTVFVVEANGYERLSLWTKHCHQGSVEYTSGPPYKRYKWEQDNHGIWYQIGELAGLPICVSFFWNKIDGHRVLFYECTSRVYDLQVIDGWLKAHCNPTWDGNRRAHCDAMNFHHCLDAIDDLNGKK